MNSEEIYREHGQEIYFFILKKVKDKDIANDIFQSSFLKIHKSAHQVKEKQKVRSWAFQISRNEIANYFNKEPIHENLENRIEEDIWHEFEGICCFDRFIDELPKMYREVIELTVITGKKQDDVAKHLDISLANVKGRIRRAKSLMRERFQECCKFETNHKGKLVGTPNCVICH